jgi:hypothetical protein
MLLAQALVNADAGVDSTIDLENGNILPEIPLHKAGQVSGKCSEQRPRIVPDRKPRSWRAPTSSPLLIT